MDVIIERTETGFEKNKAIIFNQVQEGNMFFNVIDIGYKKWQSEDISGIDDPQTKVVTLQDIKSFNK